MTIAVPATDVSYDGGHDTSGGRIANSRAGGATLTCSFTLNPGRTIAPGTVTFAAQMSGNGATYEVAGDSWTATCVSGGVTYARSGKF
jgi:hypothetical protein